MLGRLTTQTHRLWIFVETLLHGLAKMERRLAQIDASVAQSPGTAYAEQIGSTGHSGPTSDWSELGRLCCKSHLKCGWSSAGAAMMGRTRWAQG